MKRILLILVVLASATISLAQAPTRELDFSEGLAAVLKSSKYGFVDVSGNTVIPYKYKNVLALGFNEGLCGVTKNGKKWFYIDKQGNQIGKQLYLGVTSFREGLAAVSIDKGKAIYINKQGEKAIDAEFAYAEPFFDGIAVAGIYDRTGLIPVYGFIDKTGKWISPSFYDEIYSDPSFSPFAELGVVKVRKGSKIGYVNRRMLYYDSLEMAMASNVENVMSIASSDGVAKSSAKEVSVPVADSAPSVVNVADKPRVYNPVSTQTTPAPAFPIAPANQSYTTLPSPPPVTLPVVDDQSSKDKQTVFLGLIVSYDMYPEQVGKTEGSGGFTVGLGIKKYFTDNVFTWGGATYSGYYTTQKNEDVKYKSAVYSIRIPLNVGLSFGDEIFELSTGPCVGWYVGGHTKTIDGGTEVEKSAIFSSDEMKKAHWQWIINIAFSIVRCSLMLPLEKEYPLMLSFGIGF
ncbi:MAG: WG repeat-containing protein [Bacteroidales bacterium]|nr:WG repeat-containing protein [Bacteroidales bacterium]